MTSEIIATVFLTLLFSAAFCWCMCAFAGEADEREEELQKKREKEAEDRITKAVREAAEEMGYEVTVKDGTGGDTFESLFGVSVEDLKKIADTEGNEETK